MYISATETVSAFLPPASLNSPRQTSTAVRINTMQMTHVVGSAAAYDRLTIYGNVYG